MVFLNSQNFYIFFVELLLCAVLFGRSTNSFRMNNVEPNRSILKHNNRKLDIEEAKGTSFIEDSSSYIMLLSRNKPGRQSSNYSETMSLADAALDGDLQQDSTKNRSCSHTKANADYPWFLVDLEDEAMIDRVDLYNRMDCCSDRLHKFIVYVSNTDNPNEFTKSPSCEAEFTGNLKNTPVHHVSCSNKIGRYVIVYINDKSSILSLCELEVFGRYVDKCDNGTHNCKENQVCRSKLSGGYTCEPTADLSAHINMNM